MKKWYQWFYLSIGYAIVGVRNFFNGKEIISAIVLVSLGVAFGFIQFLCDRKSEKGKKAYKDISMKKLILLVLALVCTLSFVGCQKSIGGAEVYSFPEPTTMITGSFYSQGQETAFEIGSEGYDPNDLSTNSISNWFYDLKLTTCDEPEVVEGAESYHFNVKGEIAFIYEDRGDEAYIIIGGNYYKVRNPSVPPID